MKVLKLPFDFENDTQSFTCGYVDCGDPDLENLFLHTWSTIDRVLAVGGYDIVRARIQEYAPGVRTKYDIYDSRTVTYAWGFSLK